MRIHLPEFSNIVDAFFPDRLNYTFQRLDPFVLDNDSRLYRHERASASHDKKMVLVIGSLRFH